MTKYLFLLGFSLCSISFMSGCKMSDFYSAPVTNADSAPVAKADSTPVAKADSTPVTDTDSAPVADTDSAPVTNAAGPTVYKGIVYENGDIYAVSCNLLGMKKIIQSKDESNLPPECEEGAFSKLIILEEEGEAIYGSDYKYVRSSIFISSDNGDNWEEAYLRVNQKLVIKDCQDSDEYRAQNQEWWIESCDLNTASYETYKRENFIIYSMEEEVIRSPDSINKANQTIYKGIVYKNGDIYAVSCNWQGMKKIIQSKDESNLPPECEEGAFSKLIILEEEGEAIYGSDYKYVRSSIFISSDNGDNWEEAYLRVNQKLVIKDCQDLDEYRAQNQEWWIENCDLNTASYETYKRENPVKEVKRMTKYLEIKGSIVIEECREAPNYS